MTEGGGMYQRLVNVPLWIGDIMLMKQFHGVGYYFFYFTPPVLILWLIMVFSSWKYNGKSKMILRINHIFFLSIILSTAVYFIPFLSRYVGNTNAVITNADVEQLNTWSNFSIVRQVLGFAVIAIYVYLYGVVNKETST